MLKLPLPDVQRLQTCARDGEVESCAVGLAYPAGAQQSGQQYVVRELAEVPDSAYAKRTATSAVLRPEYCIEISNRARQADAGVVLAHTHPGQGALQGFSAVDDAGEEALASYFRARIPGMKHFAAVFTSQSVHARELGTHQIADVAAIGRTALYPSYRGTVREDFYDRQVRAFGTTGQQVLSQLCVAVVGLGGTGSVVAQQLAHLGVGRFVLIDPDKVEATNLNRLVGAVLEDVGNTKVSVAARHIKAINSQAQCEEIVGDITYLDVAAHLPNVDFIFGCTDSVASRAVMNQLAYQYLVPCIDVGVGIYVNAGKVEYITGRAQMLSPGLACMVCTDKLDAEQIRRELMTEDERRKDQYIQGEKIPQPAVVSLNSTMSSAAVTMFLAAVTGIPSDARLLHYDGIRGAMRPAGMEPRPHCIVCSSEGALARGSSWTLPTR